MFTEYAPDNKRSINGYHRTSNLLVPDKTEVQRIRTGQNVLPTFCQHLRFSSVTQVMFVRFCPNFHHTITVRHCMFGDKIGAEGSVLQKQCHFVIPPDFNG